MDMTTNVNFAATRPHVAAQLRAGKALPSLRHCQTLKTVASANDNEVLLRSAMVFLGVVLCLAAFGLWLVPEAMESAEQQLIRAGLTCVFIGAGFTLFRKGRDTAPVIGYALDQARGELRQLLINADGTERTIARLSLHGATREALDNGDVLIRDAKGTRDMRLAAQQAEALFDHPLSDA
ncbi:hypothetical protein [Thalassovita mediterranea]|jgi:hypothetical protein|uniref:Uncharacterized protein n=1 Tax=Thalassovita mediterranea TaxID=340021 RepID=A0A0N7M213_9RHOB|nr:hypothetical protein [Thalassovita mediterranea]CUH84827.1 hypothetical protein TM5383_02045 [Thalassovita mediterranea]SIS29265.1 hypothetical protein SAMN05421685_101875 [Thalassovita mediterranea]